MGAPKAEIALRGADKYKVRFANVDDQLRLWIDGWEIVFDLPTTYEPLDNFIPTEADLLPAGIASRGASMEISHLRLLRDLYYIADDNPYGQPLADYEFNRDYPSIGGGIRPLASEVDALLSTPEYWSFFAEFGQVEYKLGEGEFLALGDNSGESRDSRLWANEGIGHCVPRELLVGKALFVYWPHPTDHIPGTRIPFPYFPNFQRMWVIR